MQDQAPILSLRMRAPSAGFQAEGVSEATAIDSLVAMMEQEAVYRCRDYVHRRSNRKASDRDSPVGDLPACPSDEVIDALCREKMCEWSYRVCDHFNTNREIAAFAFSFLDRFVDRCSCDRTAFKLASMTTLYMATKMLNAKHISLCSLAELSRGEFEMAHIAEMERIILQTLEWRLNPPTVQSYINRLQGLFGVEDAAVARAIYQRAVFFAELSLYDYSFVTKDRCIVAVSCILNAMEGIDDTYLSHDLKFQFLERLQSNVSLTVDPTALESIQARMWYLYSCSAQLQEDDILPLHTSKELTFNHASGAPVTTHSPVSVQQEQERGRY